MLTIARSTIRPAMLVCGIACLAACSSTTGSIAAGTAPTAEIYLTERYLEDDIAREARMRRISSAQTEAANQPWETIRQPMEPTAAESPRLREIRECWRCRD